MENLGGMPPGERPPLGSSFAGFAIRV